MEKFYHNYCRWIERVIIKDDLSSLVDDRRTMPDAIVIGSGIGGLVAASLLARYGKDVLVWDSHGIAGVPPEDIVIGFQHPSKRPKN